MFTSCLFYIDEFIALGHAEMTKEGSPYIAFVEPGNVFTSRAGLPTQVDNALGATPPGLPQMLTYHLVREDHVLDEELPLWAPIPALAEIQVALERAVSEVTGCHGAELKRVMRTGTLASTDNRNWELLPDNKPLHGEIKLPGRARHFYRERVNRHLQIGICALELLLAAEIPFQ